MKSIFCGPKSSKDVIKNSSWKFVVGQGNWMEN